MTIARRSCNRFGVGGVVRFGRVTLTALMILTVVGAASAQQYLTLPVDEAAKQKKAIAQRCLKDPATYAASKADFNEYFTKYHFPSMTRTEPDKLGDIGKLREEFFKYFLWKTTDTNLQHDLTDLAFKQMAGIVLADDPPCHPAVRYNAILVIGMLDDQYSPDGRQAPKPYGPATKALTNIVDQATTSNRFPPSVILGALIGLERHAQLHESLSPDAVTAMQSALLKLVTNEKPILEMDRDAYAWLRLRAASALARLGSPGDKNVVHNAIVQLTVTNKSLDDRCEAAGLLEKIVYKNVKLDDASTAEPLFALARDIAATENQRAQDFQDRGTSGSMAMPAYNPGSGMTDPNAFQRRQTLARLSSLRAALTAVKGSLPAETQKKADAVLKATDQVFTAASGKDTVDLRLAEMIHAMNDAVNKAAPGPAKPEADKAKENSVF